MRAKMFNVAIRSFVDIFLQVTALYHDNIIRYITFYALPYQNINTEKKATTMNKEMCIKFNYSNSCSNFIIQLQIIILKVCKKFKSQKSILTKHNLRAPGQMTICIPVGNVSSDY